MREEKIAVTQEQAKKLLAMGNEWDGQSIAVDMGEAGIFLAGNVDKYDAFLSFSGDFGVAMFDKKRLQFKAGINTAASALLSDSALDGTILKDENKEVAK